MPTSTPLPPPPSFALTYHVEAEYSPELADTESEAYQNMSTQVVDAVYILCLFYIASIYNKFN